MDNQADLFIWTCTGSETYLDTAQGSRRMKDVLHGMVGDISSSATRELRQGNEKLTSTHPALVTLACVNKAWLVQAYKISGTLRMQGSYRLTAAWLAIDCSTTW